MLLGLLLFAFSLAQICLSSSGIKSSNIGGLNSRFLICKRYGSAELVLSDPNEGNFVVPEKRKQKAQKQFLALSTSDQVFHLMHTFWARTQLESRPNCA